MSDIEHWIGVRMTAGYGDEDFRDLMRTINTMRSVAEAVVVESAEVPQPQGLEALKTISAMGGWVGAVSAEDTVQAAIQVARAELKRFERRAVG